MVFFTCNSCGQCIKKVHVEKHYLTECRNCEVLSCMDCGKDFVGDDYKHHTKCVSENEKYGGKDYRANAKPNKGEVKQSQWIECVQAASSAQSVSPRVRGLLNRLADYNNIPRKKAKFEKFVQNSLKVWDASLIEQIWAVFSEAGSKQKEQPEPKSTNGAGHREAKGEEKYSPLGRQGAGHDSGTENGESSEAQADKHCEKDTKKKKKKKKDKDLVNQEDSKGETSLMQEGGAKKKESEEGDTDSPKKKKKKKRDKEQQAFKEGLDAETKDAGMSDADRTSIGGVEQEERSPSKKKKKETHKKHSPEGKDVTEPRDKERQNETHRDLKQEENSGKRKHKHKKGHLKDESKREIISKGDSNEAAEGDVRLKMDSGLKKKKAGMDHVNGDGEKRKQKRKSVENEVGDAARGSVMDGLLSQSRKKKRKRQIIKLETGCHQDGLLFVNEKKKKKTKKHKDDSQDQDGDNLDELVTETKVDKSEIGTVHISRKKKKSKSKHTEGSTDDNTDANDKSDKKKHQHKDEDVYLKERDPGQQTEKKKKKKRKLYSLSDKSGMQLESQDECGNFEKQSQSIKPKKPQKRNLAVDSADDIHTPLKKKKQTKVVDVHAKQNGHTAQEKSQTKKKKQR